MTYEISSDPARFDRDRFHAWISEHSYWAKGRERDVTERACDVSLVWGAYATGGEMVGAARVVTDGVTFAWVCDVYVEDGHRGCGVGGLLIGAITGDERIRDVKRMVLATLDAHELYRPHGFAELRRPELWMIRPGSIV